MNNISCCWRLRELSAVRRAYARLQGVDDNLSSVTPPNDGADGEGDELPIISPGGNEFVVCDGRTDEQHISISDGVEEDDRSGV
jgi:hypothetical protein